MNTSNITRRHFFHDCAVGTGEAGRLVLRFQP